MRFDLVSDDNIERVWEIACIFQKNAHMQDKDKTKSELIKELEVLRQKVIEFEKEITDRNQVEEEREKLILKLQGAFSKINILKGLLPICASCKKIRDDTGYWNQIEEYIRDRSEADFSHGICPECAKKLYPELNIFKDK